MDDLVNKIKKQVDAKYNSKCPKCGRGFNCEVKAGKGSCWCFYEKAGKSLENMTHQDCLCRDCLTKN